MDRFNLNANDAVVVAAEEEVVPRELERLTCVDADYLLEKSAIMTLIIIQKLLTIR